MSRWFWAANAAAKLAAWLVLPHWPAAIALFIGPDLAVLFGLFAPGAQWVCPEVAGFAPEPGARQVWLTIDDGPDPVDTPQLLDLLERHRARATFFVIGSRAARHPELLAEIVRRGHQLGHHTATHPAARFWFASGAVLRRELDEPLPLFTRAGCPPRVFRPPVGIKHLGLARALAGRGLTCVGWTIRTGDCFARTLDAPLGRVLRGLRPGVILLAHEGPSVPAPLRVRFLAQLLDALAARGYVCVIPSPGQWRRTGPPRCVQ